MERQELIEKIQSVKDVKKQAETIYEVLDALGITYKRTGCKKCLADLMNIAKEELGIIGNAAEQSSFDAPDEEEYVYLLDRPQTWNGHIIGPTTPVEVVREFVKAFPRGYYRRVEK
ncbi:MAG: hypothetical protein IKH15_08120 [Bacteroidales bacterium]|nr:hypothetical protein [Bacteroidales bacterium]MBR4637051.1 hypothetical protein [Bacteroidales bacterium]